MGFAGQIFAARVAVGLATPSPQALSDAGKTLSVGVQAIYGKLNQQKVKAAKDRESAAQQELATAQANLDKFRKTEAANLGKATSRQVKQVEGMGQRMKQAIEGSTAGADGAFSQLKKMVPKGVASDLFKGTEKLKGELDKAQKMGSNYAKMTETQQAQLHQGAKKNVEDKEALVTALKKTNVTKLADIKTTQKQMELYEAEYEGARGRNSTYRKTMKSFEESIQAKKDDIEVTKKLVKDTDELIAVAKNEKQVIDDIKQSHDTATKSVKASGDVLETKYNKAQTKAKKVTKETKIEIDGLRQKAQLMGQSLGKAATEISAGFNNALRDSIGVMTAFYYKLNQNTQELIAFERELVNAGSVFGGTTDELYEASSVITQFGQRFGIEMQNGATGLYQLASAGLTTSEALTVLPETLKLSMAVQGDHNTIAKLTTQTIKGFGMEMTDAAIVTDKFAYAIQKSLIEYEDLSSAVKFALPFFTSTGQSIDQLLGSLQILTNRALEAGIAGRGLRQALAQFAKHAEDNDTAFRKMGISVLDAEGNMRQLNEIAAEFARVVGEDTVSNTELLTSLIEDLNVRGATAFVHLVQASDEFTEAVENTANAGGELDTMVAKQNESLSAQIQILQNNVGMIFMLRDATYEGTGYLNAFHQAVHEGVQTLKDLLVVEEEGTMVLTAFGQQIQDIATNGIKLLVDVMKEAVVIVKEFTDAGALNMDLLRLYAIPLKLILDFLNFIGPTGTKFILYFSMLNKLLPVSTLLQGAYVFQVRASALASAQLAAATIAQTAAQHAANAAEFGYIIQSPTKTTLTFMETVATAGLGAALWNAAAASWAFLAPWLPFIAIGAVIIGIFYLLNKEFKIIDFLIGAGKIAIKAFGEAFTQIYDDHIYPFLWTVGKEMIAFGAITAFVFRGIIKHVKGWIEDNGAIIRTLKWIFDRVKMVAQIALALVILQVKTIYNVIETWIDILGEVYAFVTGEQSAWETVENIVGHIKDYFVQWWENIDEAISSVDALAGPWDTFKEGVKSVLDYFDDMYDKIMLVVDAMKQLSPDEIIGSVTDSVTDVVPNILIDNPVTETIGGALSYLDPRNYANGGYVKGMAEGGSVGSREPYLVGELGPELFMPNDSGQVINNRRTLDMLGRSMEGGPALKGGAQDMVVQNLVVSSAQLKGTRMAIDSFAGVI